MYLTGGLGYGSPKHHEHFRFPPIGQQELPLPSVGEVGGWVLLVIIRADMSDPVLYPLSLLLLQQACALSTRVIST